MRQVGLLGWLISTLILFNACNVSQAGEPTLPPTYVEIPFADLVLKEPGQAILADPGIPGCRLADLPPLHWKEVDSGFVDIRTPEEYTIQSESLYQEGYLGYQQARIEYPDRYQSNPEMSYEEFLATCNAFPEVDFEQHSVLGAHAMGTGCSVAFEKHVYRDDLNEKVLYDLEVVEEGACDTAVYSRNLIVVPRIPPNHSVEFLTSGTVH